MYTFKKIIFSKFQFLEKINWLIFLYILSIFIVTYICILNIGHNRLGAFSYTQVLKDVLKLSLLSLVEAYLLSAAVLIFKYNSLKYFITILLGIAGTAIVVYSNYYTYPPSIQQLEQAVYIEAGVANQVMVQLLSWHVILIIISSILFTILFLKKVKIKYHFTGRAIVVLLALYVGNACLRSIKFSDHKMSGDRVMINCFGLLGNYAYGCISLINNVTLSPLAPCGTVNSILVEEKETTQKRDVILLQVESLDKKIVQLQLENGEYVMPFLASLHTEHEYKGAFYAPKGGGGSSDADFCVNYSLLPIRERAALRNIPKAADSIVDVLEHTGYHSIFAHANSGDYFGRNTAYKIMGYQQFYDQDDFSTVAGTWNSKDLNFVEETIEHVKKHKEENKTPVLLYMVTMQSHGPFTNHSSSSAEYIKNNSKGYNKLELNYLATMKEVDLAIQYLFQNKHFFNDPVIVVFSDHSSGVLNKPIDGVDTIPLFFYGVKFENSNHSVGALYDLAPTLCDILNIAPSTKWIGDSLLPASQRQVIFPDNKAINSKGELQELSKHQLNILKYSNSWLK